MHEYANRQTEIILHDCECINNNIENIYSWTSVY